MGRSAFSDDKPKLLALMDPASYTGLSVELAERGSRLAMSAANVVRSMARRLAGCDKLWGLERRWRSATHINSIHVPVPPEIVQMEMDCAQLMDAGDGLLSA